MRPTAAALRLPEMPRGAPTTQVALRLDPDLLARADALVELLEHHGELPSRASVLRRAVSAGLEVLEAEARTTPKRAKKPSK
jgi:hypothetical protein